MTILLADWDCSVTPLAQSADQPRHFSAAGRDGGKAVICMTLNIHDPTWNKREAHKTSWHYTAGRKVMQVEKDSSFKILTP